MSSSDRDDPNIALTLYVTVITIVCDSSCFLQCFTVIFKGALHQMQTPVSDASEGYKESFNMS